VAGYFVFYKSMQLALVIEGDLSDIRAVREFGHRSAEQTACEAADRAGAPTANAAATIALHALQTPDQR
uniref:hypothetical protein n=1 Tax=Pseudomonas simiae TaxID=321846 RepID=UPI002094D815